MKVLVKNVNGSSRFAAPKGYSSWLEYWKAQTGINPYYCTASFCYNHGDLVGAHVVKANSSDGRYYIVPLCKSCNARTEAFYVDTTLVPVPSNL